MKFPLPVWSYRSGIQWQPYRQFGCIRDNSKANHKHARSALLIPFRRLRQSDGLRYCPQRERCQMDGRKARCIRSRPKNTNNQSFYGNFPATFVSPVTSKLAYYVAIGRCSCRDLRWQTIHPQDELQDPTVVCHARKSPG